MPSVTMSWDSDDFQFGQCMIWESKFGAINFAIGVGFLSIKSPFNYILLCLILLGTSDYESNPCSEGHCCLPFWCFTGSFSSRKFVCECLMFNSGYP